MMLTGHYHLWYALLSILIAIFSAYTSLNIASHLRASKGFLQLFWIVSGAFTLGLGIWSMHVMAMLAMHFNTPVYFDFALIFLSAVLAVVASGMAFIIVRFGLKKVTHRLISAFFIGTGIVSMHFVGMMAMGVTVRYNLYLVGLSGGIAFFASLVALFLLFKFDANQKSRYFQLKMFATALVMGIGILSTHYIGMIGSAFILKVRNPTDIIGPSFDDLSLASWIITGMLLIIGIMTLSIYLDRRFQAKSTDLEFMDQVYQSLIMTANDSIVVINGNGEIIAWNKMAERVFGYTYADAVGAQLDIIIPESYREDYHKDMVSYSKTRVPHILGKTVELEGLCKNGDVIPIELSISTFQQADNVYFSGVIRDISEWKRNEERIIELAYRDPLTNLPNRRLLNDHLSLAMKQVSIHQQMVAVLFIDLDRFKYINDTFGYGIGDKMMLDVTARIETCIEGRDMLARQSGDEFILVLSQTTKQQAAKIAQKIIQVLEPSFKIEVNDLFVTGSIGISLYPLDGNDANDLITNAETTMYQVKKDGKNHYQFFRPEMSDQAAQKTWIELGLRKALLNEEFELFYQPQVNVKSGEIVGVEALIRWNHPEWGRVSPGEFIPVAEETDLIIPMGEWIIRTACQQVKLWEEQGFDKIRMGINISARQFTQDHFVEHIRNIISETGIDPTCLELEITESMLHHFDQALYIMGQLKTIGVYLSLDDFGTGYSSLSYLRSFPLDTLKIDKAFIDSVTSATRDAALTKTIIDMAGNLGMNVIAEGVETREQLEFLTKNNCDEYQGYLFSRPAPAKRVETCLLPKRSGTSG